VGRLEAGVSLQGSPSQCWIDRTSLTIVSISSSDRNAKPWKISHLNLAPGGSTNGLVQYTPLTPFLSWPPYAYSLSPTATPEWRSDPPTVHRKEENLPGYSRRQSLAQTSVVVEIVARRNLYRLLPEGHRHESGHQLCSGGGFCGKC